MISSTRKMPRGKVLFCFKWVFPNFILKGQRRKEKVWLSKAVTNIGEALFRNPSLKKSSKKMLPQEMGRGRRNIMCLEMKDKRRRMKGREMLIRVKKKLRNHQLLPKMKMRQDKAMIKRHQREGKV